MKCKTCGGQIPDGSKACGFCETEVEGADSGNRGELTDLEKRMAEILMGKPDSDDSCQTGCGGCLGGQSEAALKSDVAKPTWWKGEDCSGCGGGLTGPDKDLKYALTIVGLIVGVIAFALAAKYLSGIWL